METPSCFFIFILIVTGIVLIGQTVPSQLFLTLAQTGASDKTHNNTKGTDSSHRFSLEYRISNPFIEKDGPHWKVTVAIKADPETKPIDYVTWTVNLNPGNPVQTINSTDPRQNFGVYFSDLYAGVGGEATAHYKDGHTTTLPFNIPLKCSQECSSQLNITAKMTNRNVVKVNGTATAKYGTHITNISIKWGDTNKSFPWPNNTPSKSKTFSFDHTYHTVGSYTITITARNDRGFDLTQNVTTTGLLYEHYLPPDSPLRVSESANSILQISTTSDVVQSDTPMSVVVKLLYLNGSGIGNQGINITASAIDNPNVYTSLHRLVGMSDIKPRVITVVPEQKPNGEYTTTIEPHVLSVGKYKIVAQPEGQRYVGFNVTKELTVSNPALTFDQFITYLSLGVGIGSIIIGAIIKAPGYFRGKKQAFMLRSCIRNINDEYHKFEGKSSFIQTNKDQYLKDLERLRSHFMNLLGTRDITADQYKVLDDMITTYSNRVK